jgi:ribosomal protein L29
MAKKKKGAISELSVEDMQQAAAKIEAEIFALRNELAFQRKLEKPHLLKEKRHEHARILTFLTQNRSKAQ